MQNNQEYINIVDTFEHALKNLHTLPDIEKNIIASNIVELEYIDKLITRENSKPTFEGLVRLIASDIGNKTAIVDIFQLSAIVYKGRQVGYNVDPLVTAMNENGEWLMQEQLKNM